MLLCSVWMLALPVLNRSRLSPCLEALFWLLGSLSTAHGFGCPCNQCLSSSGRTKAGAAKARGVQACAVRDLRSQGRQGRDPRDPQACQVNHYPNGLSGR